MKTNLILLTAVLLFSLSGISQDFSTKPYTIANDWVKKDLTIKEINKNIPEGYKLVLEETDKLVFEKEVNSKVYEIKVFFKDSKITGVMFTQHIDRVWKLMSEIKDDLKFKMINSMSNNGIEMNTYENQDKNLNASMIINEGKRIISCFFNKK
jgi:hypothetical protein